MEVGDGFEELHQDCIGPIIVHGEARASENRTNVQLKKNYVRAKKTIRRGLGRTSDKAGQELRHARCGPSKNLPGT